MDTTHRLWTMDDAGQIFGDPQALIAALHTLHADVNAMAPGHRGTAIAFDQDGTPIIGPTVGQQSFAPTDDNASLGRVFHGWLKTASAHARLKLQSHHPAARALWAILDAFAPDLHPITHLPSFVLTGPVGQTKLAVASGPLRTGSAGLPWSEIDIGNGIDTHIPLLWDAAMRAIHSTERFFTGTNMATLRAASLPDAHAILRTLGHAAHWAVEQPLLRDGVAQRMGRAPFVWENSDVAPHVRALGSALAHLAEESHRHDAAFTGMAVWMDGRLHHQVRRSNGKDGPIPHPLGGIARRAFGRLARIWPSCTPTWGAPPRLVWTRAVLTSNVWKVTAESAGMAFDLSSPSWGQNRTPDGLDRLDPFVVPTSPDAPWWVAAHHDGTKPSRARLFQADDVAEAEKVCLDAARRSLSGGTVWHPFRHGRLALWPVDPPTST